VAAKKVHKKLCPQGVHRDCLYCVKYVNGTWVVLDQKGQSVDEGKNKHDAMSNAESYISQCEASRSGYGGKGKKPLKFTWGRGKRR